MCLTANLLMFIKIWDCIFEGSIRYMSQLACCKSKFSNITLRPMHKFSNLTLRPMHGHLLGCLTAAIDWNVIYRTVIDINLNWI